MKKIVWLGVSVILALTMVLASCGGEEEPTEEPTLVPTEEPTEEPTEVPTEEPVTPGGGNWWDVFGEPEYGGTMTLRATSDVQSFDWYRGGDSLGLTGFVYEGPGLANIWTLDRGVFPYLTGFTDDKYWAPGLVESWDMSDPYKHVFHVRKGVKFHDKAPVNGREMTADDVGWTFCRIIGVGYGFDKPTPYRGTGTYYFFDKIYSTDKYTLVFEFTKPVFDIQDTIANAYGQVHPKEVIEVLGERAFEDWKNQIGTGPWMMKDYVTASGGQVVRNPNYWGYDERFPDNQLPYMDGIKVLLIPDSSTAYAALRTGKIDTLPNVNWEIGEQLLSSNPHLKYIAALGSAYGLRPRVDVEPYDDIRVRKALNMAIDRETIAASFYGGHVDGIPLAMTSAVHGYYEPYTEWPQDVQDGYMYDPEGAKALLAEAGYPNGFKTSVTIGSTSDLDLCQIFQDMLSDVGIEMEINVVEATVFYSYVNRNRQHEQMAWDYFAWGFSPMRPFTLFYSTNVRDNQNIDDPTYDEMYEKEVWTSDEPIISSAEYEQRLMNKVKALNQYIVSQYWIVPGPQSFTYSFWQPWIMGYSGEIGRCQLSWSRVWIDEDVKMEIVGQ